MDPSISKIKDETSDETASTLDNEKWILELETALLSDCDINVIRKLSNQHSIPNNLRYEFWQVCLGIKGRAKILEDIFDLPEQNLIRNDCQKLVEKLDNSDAEKLSIKSDLESIITNFSRLNRCPYDSENGWIDLLEALIHLNIRRDELFKIFETIELRYVSKYYNCYSEDNPPLSNKASPYMQPFYLLRLLLLYHDPELCNYFDTIKLTPENFSSTWFRSLFCSLCNPNVSLNLLDVYFTYSNPFMIFFLALVMIINLKDDLKMKNDKTEIVSILSRVPSSITESDIKDMFFIAEQHFLNKTPSSIKEFQRLLFQVYPQQENANSLCHIENLSNLLCLPISIQELLNSCQNKSDTLHYFVVDCRPPDQYNNGHLLTAFHLDCSLMLNDPSAFGTAVQALLASQRQAIEHKSIAGGEHLCFMGSGRDDEDCYIHMVVSSFLQKHHKYVSLLHGGYDALHQVIMEKNMEHLLVDHNIKHCLACINKNSNTNSNLNHTNQNSPKITRENVDQLTSVFLQKFSNVVKPKFSEMKEKLVEYVVNPNQKPVVKHVSSDNLGKRYKGSKFSLDDSTTDQDDDEDTVDSEIEKAPEIEIEEWKKQNSQQLIGCFECSKINSDGSKTPGFLAVTKTHLNFIKKTKERYGKILFKRPLELIFQITSKRKCPEIITFKYCQQQQQTDQPEKFKDSLILIEPFEVIRLIKQQVVTLLDQKMATATTNDNEI